ncbi:uncharacterized protein LOC127930633 isoform X3 [Oncorhynchus keta]|uniref:uncharacterized protein LOC127930633 isoform X3 n=1 Tax=Oncorhynchus keta TaxID=8018 RepID=UPI00227AD46B|nr:uncharacterized protein LOC127930633 isoform X3 [Oncorhynchus keta]
MTSNETDHDNSTEAYSPFSDQQGQEEYAEPWNGVRMAKIIVPPPVVETIGETGVLMEVEESRIWFIDIWLRQLDALKAYTNCGGCGQLEPLPLGIDSTNGVVLGGTTFICAPCYQGGAAYRIRRNHDPIGTYAGPVTSWGATGPVTEEGDRWIRKLSPNGPNLNLWKSESWPRKAWRKPGYRTLTLNHRRVAGDIGNGTLTGQWDEALVVKDMEAHWSQEDLTMLKHSPWLMYGRARSLLSCQIFPPKWGRLSCDQWNLNNYVAVKDLWFPSTDDKIAIRKARREPMSKVIGCTEIGESETLADFSRKHRRGTQRGLRRQNGFRLREPGSHRLPYGHTCITSVAPRPQQKGPVRNVPDTELELRYRENLAVLGHRLADLTVAAERAVGALTQNNPKGNDGPQSRRDKKED